MINLIAAIDRNRGLGFNNELLVKLPSDMSHFKKLTTGHFIVQGRKTYDSIGHPLPNRHNIILTRNKDYKAPVGTFVYHDIETVIKQYKLLNNNESELFIIGGSELFSQTLEFADRIYLTIIEHSFENVDSFFPELSTVDWKVVSEETIYKPRDDKNEFDLYFLTYQRRNKE
jgi:dihydrofolate reductase